MYNVKTNYHKICLQLTLSYFAMQKEQDKAINTEKEMLVHVSNAPSTKASEVVCHISLPLLLS